MVFASYPALGSRFESFWKDKFLLYNLRNTKPIVFWSFNLLSRSPSWMFICTEDFWRYIIRGESKMQLVIDNQNANFRSESVIYDARFEKSSQLNKYQKCINLVYWLCRMTLKKRSRKSMLNRAVWMDIESRFSLDCGLSPSAFFFPSLILGYLKRRGRFSNDHQ